MNIGTADCFPNEVSRPIQCALQFHRWLSNRSSMPICYLVAAAWHLPLDLTRMLSMGPAYLPTYCVNTYVYIIHRLCHVMFMHVLGQAAADTELLQPLL